jgi:phenylpyruvate tautomerase PptA (4-oxalocrotonate tautomerase family)
MKPPKKEIIEGYETLDAFFKQFGDKDIYTIVVLEEIFKEIYGIQKTLHISDEKR